MPVKLATLKPCIPSVVIDVSMGGLGGVTDCRFEALTYRRPPHSHFVTFGLLGHYVRVGFSYLET